MAKEFCPAIKELCDQGYPGETKCILWDEDSDTCLYLENLRRIAGITRKWFGTQKAPEPAQIESDVRDARLDVLLKDINLGKEE